MKDLAAEVRASVLMEYGRAKARFGAVNNSNHESYAVILEEFEEAVEAGETFKSVFDNFWALVKRNEPTEIVDKLSLMRCFAERAASEWVQVAAMCYKAWKTVTDI